MVETMKKVAEFDVELTVDERNLLSVGYKNGIGQRRASWRILSSIEQKEESKGNEQNVKRIKEYRQKVEAELANICGDVMRVIDEHLIPSCAAGESTVFFYKMKGDYYRYLAEFKAGDDRKEAADQSMKAYEDLMIEDDDDEDDAALAQAESRAAVPPLEVVLDELEQNGDDIEVSPEQHPNDTDSVDPKNKKQARKKAKQEREKEIRAAEQRLLETDVPRTPDEFEKLVRSSPNSSFVWIKYMAFMLSIADVEKARSTAERALRTINIREENEKLNVWVAYFNLENTYGNPPEEAVQKVFQRALQYCDPKKVHLALLGVYERNKQHQLANDLLEKISKKFKHSCKVWLRRFQWLLEQHDDGVQPIVNRALLCLPRHKHIKFISQAAILEYKSGVPARGRTMFEGMLQEYPKRTDLWSVYLDQEIKLGDTDIIRSLFERAISLSLPLKKIKFLFKKYLAYEKSHGNEDRVEYVKRKAMEYAESANE